MLQRAEVPHLATFAHKVPDVAHRQNIHPFPGGVDGANVVMGFGVNRAHCWEASYSRSSSRSRWPAGQ